jgi:hypothetical protein
VIIQRTTTIAIDDLYAAQGQKVEAFDTAYIWWGGQWHELHLTKRNMTQLDRDLSKYLAVARKSKGPEQLQRQPRHAGKHGGARKRKGPRRDWSGFKAWCDAQVPPRTYKIPSGFSPKVQDQKDYEQWLADHPANAPREGQPGDGDAGGLPASQVA